MHLDSVDYDDLCEAYHDTSLVCDPLEFANRQKRLVYVMAEYLLTRDEPPERKDRREKDRKDTSKALGRLIGKRNDS